ncbi:hypothetical protein OCK74_14285 [Chitinophagaceae bacterium LB-8]|uniref:Uncharacterized protein n=1 Tax=Paraflavisolibacter caeni TaxID=2982496 RepID=A0A9X2XX32_9BACT|nr:hypothetical protein [Paraflavisolibacter caeni]MCU7550287.1 hypothetical protein [Paraflavisolibacter caeni]
MKRHQSEPEKENTSQDPSEKSAESNSPANPMEKRKTPKEGEFRNVQKSKEDRDAYDDDFEVEQEDELTERDAQTEKADRSTKNRLNNAGEKY